MAAVNTPIIRKTGVNATIQSNRALPKKLLDVFFAMIHCLPTKLVR
jgi:hypothetical protein